MSIFYLRKGFEVCGMLEDVYVARKRNRYGEPYGFVKFSNVRDVNKMTKALNAVWFGHFRVRASVAMFDRNAAGPERSSEEVRNNLPKGAGKSKVGHQSPGRQAVVKGAEPRNKGRDGVEALELEKEGPEVQVGDVILKLGNQKKQGALNKGLQEKEKQAPKSTDVPVDVAQGKVNNIFVRSYRSKSDDVQWANNGLVATVINGEAIPIVQNRIIDAGFADVVITPMGADKVFIRQEEGGMSSLSLRELRTSSNLSSRTGLAGLTMGGHISGERGSVCLASR
jgi:hypothetical protein